MRCPPFAFFTRRMVYVDSLRDYGWRLGPSSHLIADSQAELHAFAASLGLKRAWFQAPPSSSSPHYDLTATKRSLALKLGARACDKYEFIEKLQALRAQGWP